MNLSDEFIVNEKDVKLIVETLQSYTTYNFTDYSEKSLRRRIDKIYQDYRLSIPEIVIRIKNNADFVEKLIKDISVNTTEFFRDPKVWTEIIDKVMPTLSTQPVINTWHPGCSGGQEVYSMVMLFKEMGITSNFACFGSDINTDMLDEAKKGKYKYRFMGEYLQNFDTVFNKDGVQNTSYSKYMDVSPSKDVIAIKKEVMEHARFLKHNLVNDKDINGIKFDFIICRNVLIYFNQKLQDQVFKLFWDNLKDDGFLVIGLHESILGYASKLFSKNGQVYRKINPDNYQNNDWK